MSYTYVGQELEVFANAIHWKRYYGSIMAPYLGRRVLEVGAGIGATTAALSSLEHETWVCLESDPDLLAQVGKRIKNGELGSYCCPVHGTLMDIPPETFFDTILYIDVLEHIEKDHAELAHAASHLFSGGTLIVLAPAHQWLFTAFDRAIGHYRRYNRATLIELTPPTCKTEKLLYLDSAGMSLSIANRLFLHQSMPGQKQIDFWDTFIIPISRVIDRLSGFTFGKSILAIWKSI